MTVNPENNLALNGINSEAWDFSVPKLVKPKSDKNQEPANLSSKAKFTYYLHDLNEDNEIISDIHEQIKDSYNGSVEDLKKLMKEDTQPFYEVALQCEIDLTSGKVNILSADTE